MAQDTEAKPKQPRRRRATYAKRIELRLTEAQLSAVTRAREAASESTGRNISLSDIVRSAVEDGCQSIVKAMRSTPTRSGDDSRRLTDAFNYLGDEIQILRGQVRRIGHNVNAMAKHANTTGKVEGDLAEVTAQLRAFDGRLFEIVTAAMEELAQGDGDNG